MKTTTKGAAAYEAEITSGQGSNREITDEGIFATLKEAVDFIHSQMPYHGIGVRVWINNREVKIRHKQVVRDENGLPCYADNRPINPATPAVADQLSEPTLLAYDKQHQANGGF